MGSLTKTLLLRSIWTQLAMNGHQADFNMKTILQQILTLYPIE